VKKCPVCGVEIHHNSKQYKNKIYCSAACKKTAFRRRISKKPNPNKTLLTIARNAEFHYLVRQCRRAGTVQILSGHDVHSFAETMNLLRDRPQSDVELCHIAPVKGKNRIGLFHCRNLFYGGCYQNRKFRNRHISGGMWINHTDLEPQWVINNKMSSTDVLKKIEAFLGKCLEDYLRLNKVKISRKYSLAVQIVELTGQGDPYDLMIQSRKDLVSLKDQICRRKSFEQCYLSLNFKQDSKFLTYIKELGRFISYKGPNAFKLKQIRFFMVVAYMALERVKESETYNKLFYVECEPLINRNFFYVKLASPNLWSEFKDFMYETAFFAMHGKMPRLIDFRRKTMSYLVFPRVLDSTPITPSNRMCWNSCE